MSRSFAYIALLIAVLLWCAAILFLPLAASAQLPVSRIGYSFFSQICHQEDARSLHLAGYPLAVCARCSAIYFGFLAGVLLSPALSGIISAMSSGPKRLWLIAVTPMLIDVATDVIGIHASTIATRLATGTFFGVIAGLLLTPLFVGACVSRIRTHHQSDALYESKT